MDRRSELENADEHLIIVDSDAPSRQKWSRMLEIRGFSVSQAGSAEEALALLELVPTELAFFDLPLPDMSDPELLQQARRLAPESVIIIQNCQPTVESTIAAVKVGARDYLIGPVDTQVVMDAIVGALRHRAQEQDRRRERLSQQIETYLERKGMAHGTAVDELPAERRWLVQGDFRLDRQLRRLYIENRKDVVIDLTRGEADVLASLMSRPEKTLSCQSIVRMAFRYEAPEIEAQSIIRPYVSRLRQKLRTVGIDQQVIRTVRGQGYMLIAEP